MCKLLKNMKKEQLQEFFNKNKILRKSFAILEKLQSDRQDLLTIKVALTKSNLLTI